MNRPLLHVCMITYNHAPFIGQAIDGVMMQKTNFPYVLVIGEDCSTDATRDICEEYARKFPGRIDLLPSLRNLGVTHNFDRTFRHCRGQYIALCEGDDYWTDPLKLQKQVDFLETNKDYSFCFHNAMVLMESGEEVPRNDWQESRTLSFMDFTLTNPAATASCVYRNNFGPLPEWLLQMKAIDWGLHMLSARKGKVHYFPEIMSAYRKHPGGIWSGINQEEKDAFVVDILNCLDAGFDFQYHEHFQQGIERRLAGKLQTFSFNGPASQSLNLERRNSLRERLWNYLKKQIG